MEKGKSLRSIATILLIGFSAQTLLISNGLLGISLISLKKLCTCDHSNIRQAKSYPHSEDKHFSVSKLPNSLSLVFPPSHSEGKNKPGKDFHPDPKESCHSPSLSNNAHGENPQEAHFCPHETSKQNVENTALALNSIQVGEKIGNYFPPDINIIFTIHSISSQILTGFGDSLFEPPQA